MFELGVALRFLTEGRAQTLLILVGISVGIAVQIFLSALIGGLQKDLIEKTVGTAPHITATTADSEPGSLFPDTSTVLVRNAGRGNRARDPVRNWEPLVHQLRSSGNFTVVTVVAEGSGFAYRGETTRPVLLRGLELKDADRLYRIGERLKSGRMVTGADRVLIGTGLAAELDLEAGGTIRVTTASGNSAVFTVEGIFDLESKQINDSWIVCGLRRAQALFELDGGVSAVEMQVPEVFAAEKTSGRYTRSFPELTWVSWQESNRSLLAALRSQSGSSNLIQVLVLLAVTLGISSVLAVSAIQKARQIGILKALGATRKTIGRIFLIMGALLGAAGAAAGCFVGYGLITVFLAGTADEAGRPLFSLSIEPSLYFISVCIATVAGTLAASVPAHRSARLDPVEVIRNG